MPDCQLLGGGVRDLNVMAREGDTGMLRVQSAVDWLPPSLAQAGSFTLCEGEWISGKKGCLSRQICCYGWLHLMAGPGVSYHGRKSPSVSWRAGGFIIYEGKNPYECINALAKYHAGDAFR